MRILFLVKKNETYGFQSYPGYSENCESKPSVYVKKSAGLYNSTRFIVEGLAARGVHAKIVEVQDNNAIDKEVTLFKPQAVVIEALWVVPEKFQVLQRLHPSVQWFCHLHSHMPFLALEGIALEWLLSYAGIGVGLIANSEASYEALRCVLESDEVTYLPNVYIPEDRTRAVEHHKRHRIDVGCFGAVRPMKNHLLQALAAIEFARDCRKHLHFHINGSRTEVGGEPVLKNLRRLFEMTPHAELIEHPWMDPSMFLNVLRDEIDIGLQVSMSETFNVVTADYVTAGIPVVVSKQVPWVSSFCQAREDSALDIVDKMHKMLSARWVIRRNLKLLKKHSKRAQDAWFEFVRAVYVRSQSG